jgi:hypothetical protein
MSGQALPLKNKGRANVLENREIIPFPLLFKGKGRDRVKVVKKTFETPSYICG